MSPVARLAVLAVTALLPASQALQCQESSVELVKDALALPLSWAAGQKTCEPGEGCQDTLIIIENGPKVNLVLTKGCTVAEDQEARITRHRAGPGLSILSYHHVCRQADFCNTLSTTEALGALSTSTAQGTLRCPICFSRGQSCPKDTPKQTCPAGHTHCYDGVLRLTGGGIFSRVWVQGCLPRPGCNLLNGTQTIGVMDVSESCGASRSAAQALECQLGTLETVRNISELPLQWTAGHRTCEVGEGCQDTLMIVENGPQVYLALSKGCTTAQDQAASVTEHRLGPGLSTISYSLVCRHGDFCNALSNTVPLWAPPPATAQGTLSCPICFSRGQSCPKDTPKQTCPAGHTHCYDGVLRLTGGGIFSRVWVQGCLPRPGCNLLNGTQTIGAMDVSESCRTPRSDGVMCYQGSMQKSDKSFSQTPTKWMVNGIQECSVTEVCQETLLLVNSGPETFLAGSKGCGEARRQESPISIYSQSPGILVASYSHFCSSNLCNRIKSTDVLLFSLQSDPPVPGNLQCPMCLKLDGSCPPRSPLVTCPMGATNCYSGRLHLRGGGLVSLLSIQGCMDSNSTTLLKHIQTIGIFSMTESIESTSGAALGARLAPVLGLGLSLGAMSLSFPAHLIAL